MKAWNLVEQLVVSLAVLLANRLVVWKAIHWAEQKDVNLVESLVV